MAEEEWAQSKKIQEIFAIAHNTLIELAEKNLIVSAKVTPGSKGTRLFEVNSVRDFLEKISNKQKVSTDKRFTAQEVTELVNNLREFHPIFKRSNI